MFSTLAAERQIKVNVFSLKNGPCQKGAKKHPKNYKSQRFVPRQKPFRAPSHAWHKAAPITTQRVR